MVDSLTLAGKPHVQNGSLIIHVQGGPDEAEIPGPRQSVAATSGRVDSVTVEQSGPVRAVIKVGDFPTTTEYKLAQIGP